MKSAAFQELLIPGTAETEGKCTSAALAALLVTHEAACYPAPANDFLLDVLAALILGAARKPSMPLGWKPQAVQIRVQETLQKSKKYFSKGASHVCTMFGSSS